MDNHIKSKHSFEPQEQEETGLDEEKEGLGPVSNEKAETTISNSGKENNDKGDTIAIDSNETGKQGDGSTITSTGNITEDGQLEESKEQGNDKTVVDINLNGYEDEDSPNPFNGLQGRNVPNYP